MSRPGSTQWWQETALVTAGGVALAVWLWDGWPFTFDVTPVFVWRSEDGSFSRRPPPDLGDYFDAGCVTADNLRAMAEGRATRISCPAPDPVLLRDLPPNQRPFP